MSHFVQFCSPHCLPYLETLRLCVCVDACKVSGISHPAERKVSLSDTFSSHVLLRPPRRSVKVPTAECVCVCVCDVMLLVSSYCSRFRCFWFFQLKLTVKQKEQKYVPGILNMQDANTTSFTPEIFVVRHKWNSPFLESSRPYFWNAQQTACQSVNVPLNFSWIPKTLVGFMLACDWLVGWFRMISK